MKTMDEVSKILLTNTHEEIHRLKKENKFLRKSECMNLKCTIFFVQILVLKTTVKLLEYSDALKQVQEKEELLRSCTRRT